MGCTALCQEGFDLFDTRIWIPLTMICSTVAQGRLKHKLRKRGRVTIGDAPYLRFRIPGTINLQNHPQRIPLAIQTTRNNP